MTDWNSTVEHQLRPDELMAELAIKKQTYYNYLDHLGIKASKDSKGKVYLTQVQADQVRSLRSHVLAGGKIEEFTVSNSAESGLVKAESNGLGPTEQIPEISLETDSTQDLDMESLYRGASAIAVQRLTVSEQVMLAMANEMTYDDLHPDAQAEVDRIRRAAVAPKLDTQTMAKNLLNQLRSRHQPVNVQDPDSQPLPDPSLQTA